MSPDGRCLFRRYSRLTVLFLSFSLSLFLLSRTAVTRKAVVRPAALRRVQEACSGRFLTKRHRLVGGYCLWRKHCARRGPVPRIRGHQLLRLFRSASPCCLRNLERKIMTTDETFFECHRPWKDDSRVPSSTSCLPDIQRKRFLEFLGVQGRVDETTDDKQSCASSGAERNCFGGTGYI